MGVYLAAARNDYNTAQRLLVGLYRRGWGTPNGKPDYLEAIKWYLLSLW